MSRMMPTLLFATLFVPTASSAEPEIGPAPRLVERHIQLETMPGGYQILLSRKASENLRDVLATLGDGQAIGDAIKDAVKDLNDPDAKAKLEMLAWAVKTQAPAMKKALDDKMGLGGATIRVYGMEKKRIPDRPLLTAFGDAFIPAQINSQIKSGIKMINTTPLYWKVEGRK
jgi:hypothetical protein